MRDHFLNTIDARVEYITVQGKAVGCTSRVGWDCATKAVKINLLVTVVELKDVAYATDSLQILVAVRVEVVQGVHVSGVSIRERKINGHSEVNFTTAEDILKEGVLALNLEILEIKTSLILVHLEFYGALFELSQS